MLSRWKFFFLLPSSTQDYVIMEDISILKKLCMHKKVAIWPSRHQVVMSNFQLHFNFILVQWFRILWTLLCQLISILSNLWGNFAQKFIKNQFFCDERKKKIFYIHKKNRNVLSIEFSLSHSLTQFYVHTHT